MEELDILDSDLQIIEGTAFKLINFGKTLLFRTITRKEVLLNKIEDGKKEEQISSEIDAFDFSIKPEKEVISSFELKFSSEIDTLLRCPVCSEIKPLNVLTSCCHSICVTCITIISQTKRKCCICSEEFTESKPNYKFNDLITKFHETTQKMLNDGNLKKTNEDINEDISINNEIVPDEEKKKETFDDEFSLIFGDVEVDVSTKEIEIPICTEEIITNDNEVDQDSNDESENGESEHEYQSDGEDNINKKKKRKKNNTSNRNKKIKRSFAETQEIIYALQGKWINEITSPCFSFMLKIKRTNKSQDEYKVYEIVEILSVKRKDDNNLPSTEYPFKSLRKFYRSSGYCKEKDTKVVISKLLSSLNTHTILNEATLSLRSYKNSDFSLLTKNLFKTESYFKCLSDIGGVTKIFSAQHMNLLKDDFVNIPESNKSRAKLLLAREYAFKPNINASFGPFFISKENEQEIRAINEASKLMKGFINSLRFNGPSFLIEPDAGWGKLIKEEFRNGSNGDQDIFCFEVGNIMAITKKTIMISYKTVADIIANLKNLYINVLDDDFFGIKDYDLFEKEMKHELFKDMLLRLINNKVTTTLLFIPQEERRLILKNLSDLEYPGKILTMDDIKSGKTSLVGYTSLIIDRAHILGIEDLKFILEYFIKNGGVLIDLYLIGKEHSFTISHGTPFLDLYSGYKKAKVSVINKYKEYSLFYKAVKNYGESLNIIPEDVKKYITYVVTNKDTKNLYFTNSGITRTIGFLNEMLYSSTTKKAICCVTNNSRLDGYSVLLKLSEKVTNIHERNIYIVSPSKEERFYKKPSSKPRRKICLLIGLIEESEAKKENDIMID